MSLPPHHNKVKSDHHIAVSLLKIFNQNKFQTSSTRSKNLFLLNNNPNIGPGLYSIPPLKFNQGPIIPYETLRIPNRKESLKPISPGPGTYDIKTKERFSHIQGKVGLNLLYFSEIKVKKTPGVGYYDPNRINLSKSYSFPKENSFRKIKIPLLKNRINETNIIKTNKSFKIKNIKGSSFGYSNRKDYDNILEFANIGPAKYQIPSGELSKCTQKFGKSKKYTDLHFIGPGPGQYNPKRSFEKLDENMRNYKKMHDFAFKNLEVQSFNNNKPISSQSPILYDLMKKRMSFKEKTMLKIRGSINKIEKMSFKEKTMLKIRDSINKIEKKQLILISTKKRNGFTTTTRKNEYNILQKLIISPGPIYNTGETFAKNAIKIQIPVAKRKSFCEVSEIPGPGAYNLRK